MKKNKLLCMTLSIMLTLGSTAAAASFTDMPQDPNASVAIENAVKNGILSGYEDNTVRPDANITRAEMASIIARVCKVTEEADISKFSDVQEDKWYHSEMAKAYSMGAFSGDDQGKMNPESNITFQECFTVLSTVFDLLPPYTRPASMPDPLPENTIVSGSRLYDVTVLASYSDGASVANWAKPFFAGVVANGGWNGIDNKLTPTAYITRAQFAQVMNNLIQNYIDEPGAYNELPAGNTMIRCDGVLLSGTVINDNLYIGDSVSPNGITFENVTSNKKLVVRGCATPVTVTATGEKTFGNVGISLSGKYEAVRVIRPYINIDMTGAEYTNGGIYTAAGTNITYIIKQ